MDRRVRKARTAEAALRYLAPELFAIHPVEADAPEEDIHLLDITFMSPAIDAIMRVPELPGMVQAKSISYPPTATCIE